jgi:hypothetical protein
MMKSTIKPLSIIATLLFCVSIQAGVVNNRNEDLIPTGKGYGEAPLPLPSTPANEQFLLDDSEIYGTPSNTGAAKGAAPLGFAPTGYRISYHGGPIITGTTHIYYIWYGNWTGNTAPTILNNLAQNIGGSPRYNTNTTYANASNVKITNSVTLAGSTSVAYPYGKALSDAQIQAVVSTAITTGKLPKDANGVYFVLTSKDVTATSGFGAQYCGWHTYATIAATNIKYAFVGDASSKYLTSCAAQSVSPNGNPGADGMASVIVHELEETTTDPNLNAWYDSVGNENSDKCAWTFGVTTTLPSLAKYNVTLGTLKYLIQQNWVNSAPGYCAIKF